jgi:putative phosphoesterase
MKILVLSDIHNRLDYSEPVSARLQEADLVIIAGDITNFGGRDEAKHVIERLAAYNPKILAVSGNCDRPGVTEILTYHNMNLHASPTVIERVMFFGIGGCNKTPFHTPQEYTDEEMTRIFGRFQKKPDIDKYVLVTHAPPYKTKLDAIFFGFHVGSKAVRKFIESFQPDMAVCGHIHEARGVDKVGKTLIINPGPFPKHYALVDLNDNIACELH